MCSKEGSGGVKRTKERGVVGQILEKHLKGFLSGYVSYIIVENDGGLVEGYKEGVVTAIIKILKLNSDRKIYRGL